MPQHSENTWSDSAANNTVNMSEFAQEPISVVSGREAYFGNAAEEDEKAAETARHNLEIRRNKAKRSRRIKIGIASALACGLLAAVAGRIFLGNTKAVATTEPQTAVVERKDFTSAVKATGTLKAGSTVMVTPEIDGIIESVNVVEGQTVKEGDLLFTIKNEELDKAVKTAQNDLTAAQQALTSAQNAVSRAEQARDEAWNRYNENWAEADALHAQWVQDNDSYATRHAEWESNVLQARAACPNWSAGPFYKPSADVDPDDQQWKDYYAWDSYLTLMELAGPEPTQPGAEPTYPDAPDDVALLSAIDSAQDTVTTANNAVTKAQDALEDAQEKAAKRSVTAPTSGNVVAVGAKVGAAVMSGTNAASGQSASDKALVQISDDTKMEIDAEVNEVDIMAIKKGQTATVTFSAVPDAECDATVLEVASVATGKASGNDGASTGAGVVTFHVGLIVPQPDDKLRAGMSANVSITTVDEKNVLVVPAMAVVEDGKNKTVEVVVNDDPEHFETVTRQVKVGGRSSSEIVITDGLTVGETVLVQSDDVASSDSAS